jgi:tRNA-dihydrouridine synthase 2
VFRTCPEREKSRLVFQLGTANADLAVQAAKVVAADVSAIDVNSGCPKHFSIHAGMGAALLRTPDKLIDILTSLVREVGNPFNIAISVKIRLLESEDATAALVERLVQTGIKNLTLHCRTTPMRPRDPAIRDDGRLARVVQICRAAGVTCLINGDVEQRSPDLADLMIRYGVDGAMIARGAEANPSCFSDSPVPWYHIVHEFFGICKQFDNHVVNTKFCLARMIPGKSTVYQKVASSRTMNAIEEALKGATKEADDLIPRKGPAPVLNPLRAKAKDTAVESNPDLKSSEPQESKPTESKKEEFSAKANESATEIIESSKESLSAAGVKRAASPGASSPPEAKRPHVDEPPKPTATAVI